MLGATSIYSVGERNVAIVLVVCGLISLLALLVLFGRMAAAFVSGTRLYPHTHFQAYFVCLLVANAVQALGVIMGLKWVGLRIPGIVEGQFCALQGSLTLGGNIGTAVCALFLCSQVPLHLPPPLQPPLPPTHVLPPRLPRHHRLRLELHRQHRLPRPRRPRASRAGPLFRDLGAGVRDHGSVSEGEDLVGVFYCESILFMGWRVSDCPTYFLSALSR
ncbi:hypothetical protein C8R43DRAFT_166388 [Mycena crocata]|nr:hypothetical protein C8R43DRAFT_166388 [Mycena crocata]